MTYPKKRHSWEDNDGMSFDHKARCFESHPPLILGDGMIIYGGSCSYPIVVDADIYVGLEYGMKSSPKAFPWEQGESFLYPIPDMKAPTNPDQFKKLIDWLAVQLTAQKRVHVGCVGGHGRTGTVLAALVAEVMGKKDAIAYVRAKYCKKAVESNVQVEFLMKHYGVEYAPGAKEFSAPPKPSVPRPMMTSSMVTSARSAVSATPTKKPASTPSAVIAIPVRSACSIWGQNFSIDK